MALRWLEGWESATTPVSTHHSRIYATATGALSPVDGASVDINEAVSSDDAVFITPVLGSVQNSWILGLAFRPNDNLEIEDPTAAYLAMGNTDGEQVRFEFADAPGGSGPGQNFYKIRVMRGSTELASSNEKFQLPFALQDEAWIYFEFKVTIDNAVGSFEGRFQYIRKPSLNNGGAGGTTALTWDAANTNVDTQEQTSTGADRLTISFDTGNTNDAVAMDDIYCCDSTGAKNNDFLGKVIIQGASPSTVGGGAQAGDGDTVQWALAGGALSTNDAWDEALTSTEDDERLTGDTTTEIHLAAMDTPGATAPVFVEAGITIVGVRLDTIQHMETTGDLDIAQMWRKTTATAGQTASGTINVATTTYEGLTTILEDEPNTAADWDIADIPSYQYGVRNDG